MHLEPSHQSDETEIGDWACRLGWKYPWGVRLKVTQLLLAIVLRAQCETDADEAAELESLLVERLWPPLGISTAVHDSLMPFTNFQEYCRTGTQLNACRTPLCILRSPQPLRHLSTPSLYSMFCSTQQALLFLDMAVVGVGASNAGS